MKKALWMTIAYFLIQGIVSNLGHPVTPDFVRDLRIPEFMFGVFFSAMSFGLMIGGPIWGAFGDQGKKKHYIFIGVFMYAIGQIGFGYAGNQYVMVFFRFFSGLGIVAANTLLIAHVIELSDKKNRAKALAFAAAAFTMGGSLGYYIGGFMSTNPWMIDLLNLDSYEIIFLIQGIAVLLYGLLVYVTFTDVHQDQPKQSKPSIFESLKEVTHIKPSLLFFLISLTFITIGATNLSKYIDVYFTGLGYSPQDLGTFVFWTGVVSVLASVFIVPLFAKMKKQLLAITTIQLLSAAIVFYTFRAHNFILVVYTVYMIYVVFKAVYQPLEQNYIAHHASEGKFGRVMGIRQSFLSIGMVIGPLIGGFLYDKNARLLFDTSAATFLVGVGLLGIVYVLEKKDKQSLSKSHDIKNQ